jgi:LPS export ABC transporter permease LptG
MGSQRVDFRRCFGLDVLLGKETKVILAGLLIRLYSKTVLLTFVVLAFSFALSNFMESAKRVLASEATAWEILSYYISLMPSFLYTLVPVGLIVGACVSFAVLGRNKELLAMVAAGVSPRQMMTPVLSVALLFSLGMFPLSEWLVPLAYQRVEELSRGSIGRIDSSWKYFPLQQWYPSSANRLIRVARVGDGGHRLQKVIVFDLDDDFQVVRRTDMGLVRWNKDHWDGRNLVVRRFSDGEQISFQKIRKLRLDWNESQDRFRDFSGRPQEKTLGQLFESIDGMEKRGLSSISYRLAVHHRFSFPLLGLILLLVFMPWLIRPDRYRTMAGALLESLGLVFGAYLVVVFCNAAVSGRILPPAMGGWLPVFVRLLFGGVFWSGRHGWFSIKKALSKWRWR